MDSYELGKPFTKDIEQGYRNVEDIGYPIPTEAQNKFELDGLFSDSGAIRLERVRRKVDRTK